MQMSDEQRRARLMEWLDVIYADIDDLLRRDHVFWQLQRIVRASSRIRSAPGLFNRFVGANYVDALALGIRRHVKGKAGGQRAKDCGITLMRFLAEVRDYPHLVSRDNYLAPLTGAEPWVKEMHAREFDRASGSKCGHVNVATVRRQMARLERVSKTIEHFVDTKRAHIDGKSSPAPVFRDVRNSLRALKDIVVKYSLLLTGTDRSALIGQLAEPRWTDVFKFPWIGPHAWRHSTAPSRRRPRGARRAGGGRPRASRSSAPS